MLPQRTGPALVGLFPPIRIDGECFLVKGGYMKIPDIIIEIDGGLVQDVHVKDGTLTVKVIDHDLLECPEDEQDENVRVSENTRVLDEAKKQGYFSIY
jgi:hypothetical protein